MTLRDRCIRALVDENPRWDHVRAGEVLDAVLGVLADNADEWMDEIAGLDSIPWPPDGWSDERLKGLANNSLFWALAVLGEETNQ